METYRYIATYIGVLFLVAMASAIAGNVLVQPLVEGPEYLTNVFESRTKIQIAGILMLVNSVSVVGIGVLMYQILRQQHNFVAISYVATRIVESVVLIFGIINLLSLVGLSQEYVKASTANSSYLLTLGKSAIDRNWYCYNIAMTVLGVGSLFLCYLFLELKLIPKYLSILGIAGYSILAVTSLLAILDFDIGLLVTVPVFLFEVILGIWLIAKGFNSTTVAIEQSNERITRQ